MSADEHAVGPKLLALEDCVKDIMRLIAKARQAERFQQESDSIAKKLSTGFDEYGNRRVSDDLVPVCKEINARIAAEVRIEFIRRRDQKIIIIASELGEIRKSLPELAGAACLELAAMARDMAESAL